MLDRARRIVEILRNSDRVRTATLLQQWQQLGRRSLFDVMASEGRLLAARRSRQRHVRRRPTGDCPDLVHGRGVLTPLRWIIGFFRSTHCSMSIDRCQITELPKIHDPRGNLTFIEGNVHVPFDIQRVYYLYDVPGGSSAAATPTKPAPVHHRHVRQLRRGAGRRQEQEACTSIAATRASTSAP